MEQRSGSELERFWKLRWRHKYWRETDRVNIYTHTHIHLQPCSEISRKTEGTLSIFTEELGMDTCFQHTYGIAQALSGYFGFGLLFGLWSGVWESLNIKGSK